jgi:uncharacterized protein YndB with AHSA1/START domain
MNHYHRQLLLGAPPAAVYQALTTPQGLRGWWTQTCDIATTVGGQSTFHFNQTRKVMQIERLQPDSEVRWLCVQAHIDASRLQHKDEWVGTHIVFKLSPQDGGSTRLDFEHIGLNPALECFDICRDGWDQFLGSLQSLVETGRGKPFLAAELRNASQVETAGAAS